jgi:GNAT superfamily N-acetyltransferase
MARRSPGLVIHPMSAARWPDLERLFGPKGACAGCWCMYWRVPNAEFRAMQGDGARRRFKQLVQAGKAPGVLAYADGEPVGWAQIDRRRDLVRLDGARSLKCDDADEVWSLPCFFVKTGWRGKGVATALLAGALDALPAEAKIVEAYPVLPQGAGKVPAAFAWTGVTALFEGAGFTNVGPKPRGKQRYRKLLARRRLPRSKQP